MKLLLFDIDGTLLSTDGAGRKAVEAILSALAGRPIDTRVVSFSGKTDPQILREVLECNGCTPAEARALLPAALDAYLAFAREKIKTVPVSLYPGVQALLAHLEARSDVQLGLLTGNLEPMAYAKLAAAGIAPALFPFGAFGSDHEDRYQLPPIAVHQARAYTGRDFEGKDVVIIGDTEHDVKCGRSIGVCAVAVATGHYTRAQLAPHEPDHLLDDLTDIDYFVDQVLRS